MSASATLPAHPTGVSNRNFFVFQTASHVCCVSTGAATTGGPSTSPTERSATAATAVSNVVGIRPYTSRLVLPADRYEKA